jgi:surfeit locus 1 family protein
VSALSLLVALLGLALGQWQLGRAAQKLALRDSMVANAALPVLDNQSWQNGASTTANMHRRVQLRGRWLGSATVFLDNRPMGGRAGLVVVTPLQLEASGAVLLVQRGWVARNFLDRTALPKIVSSSGVVEIQGVLVPTPSQHWAMGGPDAGRIRQNLDLKAFAAELGLELAPVTVQQTGDLQDGLLREWSQPDAGVEKHFGYAFQWFTLSALVALYYVWFQIVKRFRQKPAG